MSELLVLLQRLWVLVAITLETVAEELQTLSAPSFLSVFVAATVASLILGLFGYLLYHQGERRPLAFLTLISFVGFGPFGMMGIALAWPLRHRFARKAIPFEEWYATLFPRHVQERSYYVHDLITTRRAGLPRYSSVTSFTDIMATGSLEQKQTALAFIADHFHPSFAPALQYALNDPEPAIRVLAATAVARLEKQYATLIADATTAAAEGANQPDYLASLGQKYLRYAESGLLSSARAEEVWRRVVSLAERGSKQQPDDPRFPEQAAKCLLRLKQPAPALSLLESWITRTNRTPEMVHTFFQCLFELKQYDRLRQAVRDLSTSFAKDKTSANIEQPISLWMPSASPYGGTCSVYSF